MPHGLTNNPTECDRSFTRSDALAKHMRTVHEPEPAKHAPNANANANADATSTPASGKKGPKIRLVNGKGASHAASALAASNASTGDTSRPIDPTDPNFDPSPVNDNIQYIPARHPITGQPGFMITYPPDIHFSQFESEIPANQLMRLLRRQLHWAQGEADQLKTELENLEKLKEEEWKKKEAALHGVMHAELAVGLQNATIPAHLQTAMEKDLDAFGEAVWSDTVKWKRPAEAKPPSVGAEGVVDGQMDIDEPTTGPREDEEAEAEAGSEGDDEDVDDRTVANSASAGHVESQERDAISALLGMSGT